MSTRMYTVHVRSWSPEADAGTELVKDGFSWPGFFFGPFWALWHGMWRTALVLLAAELVLAGAVALAGLAEDGGSAVSLALHVLVGLWGNDMRRRALARAGFVERGAVLASGRDAAEQRLFGGQTAGSVG